MLQNAVGCTTRSCVRESPETSTELSYQFGQLFQLCQLFQLYHCANRFERGFVLRMALFETSLAAKESRSCISDFSWFSAEDADTLVVLPTALTTSTTKNAKTLFSLIMPTSKQ